MLIRKSQLLICLLLGGLSTSVLAVDDRNAFSFQAYYIAQDDDRNLLGEKDKGFGLDLGVIWLLSGSWAVETRAFAQSLDYEQGSSLDTKRYGLAVDLRYDLAPRTGTFAYLIGGIGAAHTSIEFDEDETNATGNLGIGFMSKPFNARGMRVRGDIRAVFDDYGDGFTDYRAGLGLVIPLGQEKKPEPEVEKVAYQPPPPPPPPPVDSDGDGVLDNVDQCPNTPRGALVDARGCQKQLERDIKETLYLEFDLNKAEVRPESYAKLENLAANLRKYPSAKLVLEGHTDSTGAEAYNDKLSQRRAWAVRQVLVNKFGVDPARITAYAYGETSPIASNATKAGRAKNRRVEAIMKATIRQLQYKE